MDDYKRYKILSHQTNEINFEQETLNIENKNKGFKYAIFERIPFEYLESFSAIMNEAMNNIDGLLYNGRTANYSPDKILEKYSKFKVQTIVLTTVILYRKNIIATLSGYGNKNKGGFFLFAIYVKPEFRNRGFGYWLNLKILLEIKRRKSNLSHIELETKESNWISQKIINSLGFIEI